MTIMNKDHKETTGANFLWHVLLPLLLLSTLPSFAIASDRSNVLLILVDDLKPAIGAYSDPHAKTPNIDRLADSGMRFDLAYCNQAVCAPSRFTLMLGSHSTSTGLYGLGSPLRQLVPDAVTMPQYFAKHGYRTESLGKVFHIGHGNHGDPDSFSVAHFKEKVIEYVDPASKPGGKLTREEGMFQNVKAPPEGRDSMPRGAAFESPDVADDAYADGRVAAETIRRLRAAKDRKQPFFIAAGFARPHLPFSAPKKYWDLYDADALKLDTSLVPPTDSPKVAHKHGGEIRNYFPVPDKKDGAQISDDLAKKLVHGYYAATSFVDAQIGKVLDELKSSGQAENTIVVLWGDHGFHLGDHGFWTKHTNYEQANRIPILISAPGITQPGSATKQLAESVDIFPTLAELAGLEPPQGPQPIDGVSLVPVLKDPSDRVRDHAYHAYPKQKLGRAIRTDRYRMVQWRGFGAEQDTPEYELYDYETDPLERKNLALDPRHSNVLSQLKTILAKYPAPVARSSKKQTRKKEPSNKKAAITQPNTSPQIARRPLTITGRVSSVESNGVIVAHGGREHGYAVYMLNGRLAFDVRVNGKVKRIQSREPLVVAFDFTATVNDKTMTLAAAGKSLAEGPSPGLIPVQPKDGMNFGFDDLSAAGDYNAPNQFAGAIENVKVTTGEVLSTE